MKLSECYGRTIVLHTSSYSALKMEVRTMFMHTCRQNVLFSQIRSWKYIEHRRYRIEIYNLFISYSSVWKNVNRVVKRTIPIKEIKFGICHYNWCHADKTAEKRLEEQKGITKGNYWTQNNPKLSTKLKKQKTKKPKKYRWIWMNRRP